MPPVSGFSVVMKMNTPDFGGFSERWFFKATVDTQFDEVIDAAEKLAKARIALGGIGLQMVSVSVSDHRKYPFRSRQVNLMDDDAGIQPLAADKINTGLNTTAVTSLLARDISTDLAFVSALVQFSSAGGSNKRVWIRGIPDGVSTTSPRGTANPATPIWLQRLRVYTGLLLPGKKFGSGTPWGWNAQKVVPTWQFPIIRYIDNGGPGNNVGAVFEGAPTIKPGDKIQVTRCHREDSNLPGLNGIKTVDFAELNGILTSCFFQRTEHVLASNLRDGTGRILPLEQEIVSAVDFQIIRFSRRNVGRSFSPYRGRSKARVA